MKSRVKRKVKYPTLDDLAARPVIAAATTALRRSRPESRAVAPWRVIRSGRLMHVVCLLCRQYLGAYWAAPQGEGCAVLDLAAHLQTTHGLDVNSRVSSERSKNRRETR
jgi:hypothetical protein